MDGSIPSLQNRVHVETALIIITPCCPAIATVGQQFLTERRVCVAILKGMGFAPEFFMRVEIDSNNKKIQYIRCFIWMIGVSLLLRVIFSNVIIHAYVPSESMEPTIMTNDRLFATMYDMDDLKRGDILIFKMPDDTSRLFVKRLIGLPGDTIEIKKNGELYINGIRYEETYLKEKMIVDEEQIYVVPEDSYFMLGDNRNASYDSRAWKTTFVPKENLVGKPKMIFYPISHIKFL